MCTKVTPPDMVRMKLEEVRIARMLLATRVVV